MAKLEEPQDIPSELLDLYRGALNPHPTLNIVKKRYPYRMPRMQEGGKGVHTGQKAQRARFKEAITLFQGISSSDRARWYAAEPPWASFLWYYNYFIMSSLAGNADITDGGAGVIKSIQYVYKSIPTGGNEAITIAAVDPAKTVVMLFGNSYIADRIQRGTGTVATGGTTNKALSPSIDVSIAEVILRGSAGWQEITEGSGEGRWGDVYVSALTSSQLTVGLGANLVSTNFSYEVIEHKAQTVYPYVKTIAAGAITISWPVTPSVAAIIGAQVIEYI